MVSFKNKTLLSNHKKGNFKEKNPTFHKQAGAELGQAQSRLGLQASFQMLFSLRPDLTILESISEIYCLGPSILVLTTGGCCGFNYNCLVTEGFELMNRLELYSTKPSFGRYVLVI